MLYNFKVIAFSHLSIPASAFSHLSIPASAFRMYALTYIKVMISVWTDML